MGLRADQLARGAPAAVVAAYAPADKWPPPAAEFAPRRIGPIAWSWPPSADTLDYVQKAITVTLLLIALPALLTYAAKSPSRFANAAARKHVA